MEFKDYFHKGTSFLTNPSESLENEKGTGLHEAFRYMLFLAVITSVLGAIISAATISFVTSFIPAEAAAFANPAFIFVTGLITGYIGLVIGLLVWGLWSHLCAYMFGARKGLEQTLKTVFYGATPVYFLGWIPMINFLAGIWFLVLQGMGLIKYQEFKTEKAVLTMIVALLIPAVVIGMLMLTFFATLMAIFGTAPGMMSLY